MKNTENLKKLRRLQTGLSGCSSILKKKEMLEAYKEDSDEAFNRRIFPYIFDNTINFKISSERVLGVPKMYMFETVDYGEDDITGFLDMMSSKPAANFNDVCHARSIYNSLKEKDEGVAELFLNILDKDFKCGTNIKTVSSVFPNVVREFKVALANKYFGNEKKVDFERDLWLASRKMDGCRCIAIVTGGECETWSRQGKRFETLTKVEREIEKLCRLRGMTDIVLDGELCIVDENGDEHFDWIMREIKRKNHTIRHPLYQVFDMLTPNEFYGVVESPCLYARIDRISGFIDDFGNSDGYRPEYLKRVDQTPVMNGKVFDRLYAEAMDKGWEGLIIRKDVPYESGRTNNMLKCKSFEDKEYVVTGYHTGEMMFTENGGHVTRTVLSDVTIEHKGYEVSVGSGFSKAQRIRYAENPELIMGKTITVQYFEETTDIDGNLSLRFPTVKHVYENGRDI